MDITGKIKDLLAFDFHFNLSNIPALIVLLLLYPAVLLLPEEAGYENGLIENYQLLILLAGCFIWTIIPEYRHLFVMVGVIFFAMAVREVNSGRALFYAIPGRPNAFYSWDHIWYAPYRTPAVLLAVLICAVYFFKAKIYREIEKLLSCTAIPVWNLLICGMCFIASAVLDKACNDLILEETVELAAYISLFMIACVYAFNPCVRRGAAASEH